MNTTPTKSQYLLLLRQPAGGVPAPAELQKIMVRFGEWIERLNAKGLAPATNGLELTGKVLRGRAVTDGPYVEAKEVVGGLVTITAASLDEAVEAAGACPGLDYAMAVEVRPVHRRPAAPS